MTIQHGDMEALLYTARLALRHHLNWITCRADEERLQPGRMSFHDTLDMAMRRVKEHGNNSQTYNVLPVLPLCRKLQRQLWLEKLRIVRPGPLEFNAEKMTARHLRRQSPDNERMAYGRSELVRELLDESWVERFQLKLGEAIVAIENSTHGQGIVQSIALQSGRAGMEEGLQPPQFPAGASIENNNLMGTSHIISDELFAKALAEIQQGDRYVVYDSSRYLLDKGDMHFLKDEASAKLFIDVYAPSGENLRTFKAVSLTDIYDHFEVGQSLKALHLPSTDAIDMRPSHIVSNELIAEVMTEIQKGNHFVAYNAHQYLLLRGDMEFFKQKDDAIEFSINNSSDADNFQVIKIDSLEDVYDHFKMGQALQKNETILSLIKNNNAMNEKNLEDLEKKLLYTGFGDTLNEQLKAKITAGEKEFVLGHEVKYGKDEVVAALQFRKSDTSDMYFFNRYNMMLKNDQYPDPIKQTFYINHMQDNVTLKEAYNLMSGRAVYKELENKEGEKYNAWVQLDFKQAEANGNYKTRTFNDNYGFKLEEVLGRHPIAALQNDAEKKALLESLQRGNRQSVMLMAEGKPTKAFIEAAPQYKGLNFYDQHMKKVLAHELAAKTSPEQKQEGTRHAVKQGAGPGEDDAEAGKQKKARQRM